MFKMQFFLRVGLLLASAPAWPNELTTIQNLAEFESCSLALETPITSLAEIEEAAQHLLPVLSQLRNDGAARLMTLGEDRDLGSSGGSNGLGRAHNDKLLTLYKEFNAIGDRLQNTSGAEAAKSGARALLRVILDKFKGRVPAALDSYAQQFAREAPAFESVGKKILEEIEQAELRKVASTHEASILAEELRRAIEERRRVIDLMSRLEAKRSTLPVDLHKAFDRELVNRVAREAEDLDERAQSIEVMIKAKQTHLAKVDDLIAVVKRKVSLALPRIRQHAMMIDDADQAARLLKAGNKVEELAGNSLGHVVLSIETLNNEINAADALTTTSRTLHTNALTRLNNAQRASRTASDKKNRDIAKRIEQFSQRTAELEKILTNLPKPEDPVPRL